MRNFLKRYKPEEESSKKNSTQLLSKVGNFASKLTSKTKNLTSSLWQKAPKYRWIILAIIVVVVVGGVFFVKTRGRQQTFYGDQTYVAKGSQISLNKKFNVPIRDKDGKGTGADLIVNVTSLERSNNIIFDGKPLTARTGKDFIVINLEVENSTSNRLTVRAVDFFRLAGADGRNYAADLQTNPVTVEPVSTKKARTIYIVDQGQKSFKFLIGDVRGSQETVEVSI